MRKKGILFFIVLASSIWAWEAYFTFGDGTETNACNTVPAIYDNNAFKNCRSQLLIRAQELLDQGITVGSKIKSVGFYQTDLCEGVGARKCRIRIREITLNNLPSDSFINSGLVLVWSSDSYSPNLGWTEHVFSTPFEWNGNNLLIDVYFGDLNLPLTNKAKTRRTEYGSGNILWTYKRSSTYDLYWWTGDVSVAGLGKRANIRLKVDVLPNYDAEAVEVISPQGNLIYGDTVIPEARVRNAGSQTISFNVMFKIVELNTNNTVYIDYAYVSNLPRNSQVTLNFDPWIASSLGPHRAYAITLLTNDQKRDNDTASLNFSVSLPYNYDVGPIQIIQPQGTKYFGDTISPSLVVKNFGTYAASFNVLFRIKKSNITVYENTKFVSNLQPLSQTTVTFDPWIISSWGDHLNYGITLLPQDENRSNDTLTGSFYVVPDYDIQSTSIISPQEIYFYGDTIIPKGKVKNVGSLTSSFPVLMRIIPRGQILPVFSDTQWVSNLQRGQETTVTFSSWVPTSEGEHVAELISLHPQDRIRSNDTIRTQFFIKSPQGGPDNYGYVWMIETHPEFPPIEYIDPHFSIPRIGNDDTTRITLPFPFEFYGETYTDIIISSNGFVSFGIGSTDPNNRCIPSRSTPNNSIFVFWDDLNPSIRGHIDTMTFGAPPERIFIIEWDSVPIHFTSALYTFSLQLFENGTFALLYNQVTAGHPSYDSGGSATVGIENIDGSIGLQFSCNQKYLKNGRKIFFYSTHIPNANIAIRNVFSPHIFGIYTLDYKKDNLFFFEIENTGEEEITYNLVVTFTELSQNISTQYTFENLSISPGERETLSLYIPQNTLIQGFYNYTATLTQILPADTNPEDNSYSGWFVSVRNENRPPQLFILDLDGDSLNPKDFSTVAFRDAYNMTLIWNERGYTISYYYKRWDTPPLGSVIALFHGITPNTLRLPSNFIDFITGHLFLGGKVLAQGGDLFANPQSWAGGLIDLYTWDTLFGINPQYVSNGLPISHLHGCGIPSSSLLPEIISRQYLYPPHNPPSVENRSIDRFMGIWDSPNRIEEFFLSTPDMDFTGIITYNTLTQARTIALTFELFNLIEEGTLQYQDFWDYILRRGLNEQPVLTQESEPQTKEISVKLIKNSIILFTLPNNTPVKIEILDPQGRILKRLITHKDAGTHIFDLKSLNLPSGVFFVKLSITEKVFLKRALITN